MAERETWITSATATITGTGSGATADVETSIDMPAIEGSIIAYRLRRPSGSGAPNWTLTEKTGEADTASAYNLLADLAVSVTADGPVTPSTPLRFKNRDTTVARKLYWVVKNDGGAGDACTLILDLCVRYFEAGR